MCRLIAVYQSRLTIETLSIGSAGSPRTQTTEETYIPTAKHRRWSDKKKCIDARDKQNEVNYSFQIK